MIALLRDLVKKVRPDVSEDRLWVIQPDGAKCTSREKYPSKTGEKTLAIFLMEILPCEISFNKGAYKCYTEFLSDFEKYGKTTWRSRGSALPATSSRRRAIWPSICASLDNLARSVGTELRERQHVGYFGLDVITFVDTNSLIWTLIAPLTISALAVVMVCPTTMKWLLRQVAPSREDAVLKFVESVQAALPNF
ncbi:uncharacterized protein LOC124411149 [Diprion similis]|uniref:uncharacterized protein LOC124411149 n=1 Tax=Diprion similis TaxID=362088 RepID=UPI001EF884B0|nr:uncharacterized protein LOC124411149 [Diprion similis]